MPKESDPSRDNDHLADNEIDDLASVEEAIDAWRNGDQGVPMEEAFDEIRRKFEIA